MALVDQTSFLIDPLWRHMKLVMNQKLGLHMICAVITLALCCGYAEGIKLNKVCEVKTTLQNTPAARILVKDALLILHLWSSGLCACSTGTMANVTLAESFTIGHLRSTKIFCVKHKAKVQEALFTQVVGDFLQPPRLLHMRVPSTRTHHCLEAADSHRSKMKGCEELADMFLNRPTVSLMSSHLL